MTALVPPLPCPFCGAQPRVVDYQGNYNAPVDYVVFCDECDFALDGRHTPEEAIALWNKRDPDAAATIAALREENAALISDNAKFIEASTELATENDRLRALIDPENAEAVERVISEAKKSYPFDHLMDDYELKIVARAVLAAIREAVKP